MPDKQVHVRYGGVAVVVVGADTNEAANKLAIDTVEASLEFAFTDVLGGDNVWDFYLQDEPVVELANDSLSVSIPVMDMRDHLVDCILDAVTEGRKYLEGAIPGYIEEHLTQAVIIALRDARDEYIKSGTIGGAKP